MPDILPGPYTLDTRRSPAKLCCAESPYIAVARVYLTEPDTRRRSERYLRTARAFAQVPELLALLDEALPEVSASMQQRIGAVFDAIDGSERA